MAGRWRLMPLRPPVCGGPGLGKRRAISGCCGGFGFAGNTGRHNVSAKDSEALAFGCSLTRPCRDLGCSLPRGCSSQVPCPSSSHYRYNDPATAGNRPQPPRPIFTPFCPSRKPFLFLFPATFSTCGRFLLQIIFCVVTFRFVEKWWANIGALFFRPTRRMDSEFEP